MIVDDLYNITEKENGDSEIVAMTIVVKDSMSHELTCYSLNDCQGMDVFNIEKD